MIHLEDTPWWICDEEHTNYVAYCDTDSVYVSAEPLLRHLYPNFETMSSEKKDEILEKIALYYQDYITSHYDTLSQECFNVPTHRLEMKTECVIRSAYFRATRRYAQWITKQEGILKEKLDVKGLEFKKTNFPPILGKFFGDTLIEVLKGATKETIDQKVFSLRKQILGGEIPFPKLGNPTSVKTLTKYLGKSSKPGEIFSRVEKGAPIAVKASIYYNDLIRFWKLNNKHGYIVQGDKIKYVYLKPNPYHLEALAFLDFDLPEKIEDFIKDYIDLNKIFDSILLNKLEGFYEDLGWDLNLNPFRDFFFKLD